MKSERWNVKLPGEVYAIGPFTFDHAVAESEFRGYLRWWLLVRRLPRGTQVWPERRGKP